MCWFTHTRAHCGYWRQRYLGDAPKRNADRTHRSYWYMLSFDVALGLPSPPMALLGILLYTHMAPLLVGILVGQYHKVSVLVRSVGPHFSRLIRPVLSCCSVLCFKLVSQLFSGQSSPSPVNGQPSQQKRMRYTSMQRQPSDSWYNRSKMCSQVFVAVVL